MLNYILVDRKPIGTDNIIAWAKHPSIRDRRVIQERFSKHTFISTVFLGTDHNFFDSGTPILFETMVFKKGEWLDIQERYCTWEEAFKGHFEVCRMVLNNRKKVKTRYIQIKRSKKNVQKN